MREKTSSLTFPSSRSRARLPPESLLPPIPETRLQPKPAAPRGGPSNRRRRRRRRHSSPSPGEPGPGKENLPLLRSPEKGRNGAGAGARGGGDSARRNSDGKERAQPGSEALKRKGAGGDAPDPGRERLLMVGRKMREESDSMSEDCGGETSAEEEEEYTNERIIEWLRGVNECLYRESGLGPWPTLSHLEQDTSIKIVHEED